MSTVAQFAAAARLAARAAWTVTNSWDRWIPDNYSLAAARRISAELARALAGLDAALKEKKHDQE